MENTDIIITATFDVDPKELDDLMAKCKPLIDGALEEDGCQDYSWTLDPYVPGRIWVMERWESEESLKKHFEDEWYKNMGATLNEVGLLNAFSAKYKIVKQDLFMMIQELQELIFLVNRISNLTKNKL